MHTLICVALAACAQRAPQRPPQWALVLTAVEQGTLRVPEDSPVVPLAEADPCYGLVAAEAARVRENFERSELLDIDMLGPPREIKGRAIGNLFPNHRFFLFVWSEKAKEPLPPGTAPPAGLLYGARLLVAIDKDGVLEKFGNYWSIQLAGDFVARNRVRIRNREDAQLLWDALCEMYRRERKGEIEKVSEHLWRVGIEKTDRGNFRGYEVRLDPDFSVRSIKYYVSDNSEQCQAGVR